MGLAYFFTLQKRLKNKEGFFIEICVYWEQPYELDFLAKGSYDLNVGGEFVDDV